MIVTGHVCRREASIGCSSSDTEARGYPVDPLVVAALVRAGCSESCGGGRFGRRFGGGSRLKIHSPKARRVDAIDEPFGLHIDIVYLDHDFLQHFGVLSLL